MVIKILEAITFKLLLTASRSSRVISSSLRSSSFSASSLLYRKPCWSDDFIGFSFETFKLKVTNKIISQIGNLFRHFVLDQQYRFSIFYYSVINLIYKIEGLNDVILFSFILYEYNKIITFLQILNVSQFAPAEI